MKLVDILALELKVWPEDYSCNYCCQSDSSTEVFFGHPAGSIFLSERADETKYVEVTRAQWQAAVDALKTENCAHLWVGWSDTEACELCNKTRKVVVEWDGEGLPPVGTVCEWKEKTGFSWVKATVLFITDSSVVMQREDGFEWQMLTKRTVFRPIRTPEQIAAEERDKAIDNMIGVVNAGFFDNTRAIYGALYDAGFRKFEIVDN